MEALARKDFYTSSEVDKVLVCGSISQTGKGGFLLSYRRGDPVPPPAEPEVGPSLLLHAWALQQEVQEPGRGNV